MSVRVNAKHEPYWTTGHLGNVVADMSAQGSPTIRVMQSGNEFFALEGSHRLAAAHHLDVEPKLVVLCPDIESTELDGFHLRQDLPQYEFGAAWVLDLAAFK